MFVRVNNFNKERYYKSLVYGIVGQGYFEQYIVLNPYNNHFELVDYIDKRDDFCNTFINVIKFDINDWIIIENSYLLRFQKYYESEYSLKSFHGYEDVYNNNEFMEKLLINKSVNANESSITIRNLSDIFEWNYIKTQEDADEFLKLFAGFHDSTLETLNYIEDYNVRKINAIFDNSCWYGVVELCFEGVIVMHISPAEDNRSRELSAGCLIVKDECVFWADNYLEKEDLNYEYSYIKAYNLKWKKISN